MLPLVKSNVINSDSLHALQEELKGKGSPVDLGIDAVIAFLYPKSLKLLSKGFVINPLTL